MKKRKQAGAGLIEVAVALLVLSIGALGLARGQLAAREASGEALQRSQAILLASGLLEQVQAGPGAFVSSGFSSIAEVPQPSVDCGLQSCTVPQWGAWSLWQWRESLLESNQAGLIAAQACLLLGKHTATLELAWQRSPTPAEFSCGAAFQPEQIRRLTLESRFGVPAS